MNSFAHTSQIFLHPGEYAVAGNGCRIRASLGSCVAVTIWHPARKIGAMAHFTIPARATDCRAPFDGNYGEEAVEKLLAELTQLDVAPEECQAKILGGSNMFAYSPQSAMFDIGVRNGEMARRLMQRHRIPIASESLFGFGLRQVLFDIGSGNVWARQDMAIDLQLPQLEYGRAETATIALHA